MFSTVLTRARRSQAALALDPIPASKAQSDPLQFAEIDKHNFSALAGYIPAWRVSRIDPMTALRSN
jgi:hypothetical protein